MPGARKAKKGQTGRQSGTNASPTKPWDTESKVDEYDGRANLQAGDKGTEPGGRWSTAWYDTPAAIVGKQNVRKP